MNFDSHNIQNLLIQAQCCQANMEYDLIQARRIGDKDCEGCLAHKIGMLSAYRWALCGFVPVGEVITAAVPASYSFIINSVSNSSVLTITVDGEVIVSATSSTTDPDTFAATISGLLGFVAVQTDPDITTGEIIIYAPVNSVAQYDGVSVNLELTGGLVSIPLGSFSGGRDAEIQEFVCLTNDQAKQLIKNIQCICDGCYCLEQYNTIQTL